MNKNYPLLSCNIKAGITKALIQTFSHVLFTISYQHREGFINIVCVIGFTHVGNVIADSRGGAEQGIPVLAVAGPGSWQRAFTRSPKPVPACALVRIIRPVPIPRFVRCPLSVCPIHPVINRFFVVKTPFPNVGRQNPHRTLFKCAIIKYSRKKQVLFARLGRLVGSQTGTDANAWATLFQTPVGSMGGAARSSSTIAAAPGPASRPCRIRRPRRSIWISAGEVA